MKLMLLIIFFSTSMFAVEQPQKKEIAKDETMEEFKGTKYLNVELTELPKELKIIDDQVVQNAVDVIILSATHSIIYNAMPSTEGHAEDYKNFFGLKITILPTNETSQFFALRLFYFNWITRKYDQSLSKTISKYNVLNELRFAIYELFKGAEFVKRNSEKIERKNYERIVAVRTMLVDKKNRDKRMAKEAKKKQQKLLEEKSEEEKKPPQLVKRGDAPKETPKSSEEKEDASEIKPNKIQNLKPLNSTEEAEVLIDPSKEKDKDKDKGDSTNKSKKNITKDIKNESSLNGEGPSASELNPPIKSEEAKNPKTSELSLLCGINEDYVESQGLVFTKTNLRYFNFGAKYKLEEIKVRPLGVRLVIKAGTPIGKSEYEIPVSRNIETEIYFKNLIPTLVLFAGIDSSSIHFANLPVAGEGIQIVENDIFWAKFGIGSEFKLLGNDLSIRLAFLKSLKSASNFNQPIDAVMNLAQLSYFFSANHGMELSYNSSTFSQNYVGSSTGTGILYLYRFGGG